MKHQNLREDAARLAECYFLVGRFMYEFNHAEARLDDAIGAAFGMDALQAAILRTNVDVSRKIAIMQTILPYCGIPEKLTRHFGRFIKQF